jgi:hypothetical protein
MQKKIRMLQPLTNMPTIPRISLKGIQMFYQQPLIQNKLLLLQLTQPLINLWLINL